MTSCNIKRNVKSYLGSFSVRGTAARGCRGTHQAENDMYVFILTDYSVKTNAGILSCARGGCQDESAGRVSNVF